MPQIDRLSFVSQILWLLLVFVSFYYINVLWVLPKLIRNLKVRKNKLENLSQNISNLHDEENAAVNKYNKILTYYIDMHTSYNKKLNALTKDYLVGSASIYYLYLINSVKSALVRNKELKVTLLDNINKNK